LPGIILRLVVIVCVACSSIAASIARAQGATLIRDSEIEHIIREWSDPLFLAAGLDPASIRIFLVNDRSLNAFVAGGQNLFLHTGLLQESTSAGQVIGVMAHETGHIAGGHLARSDEALRAAQDVSLFHTLLGLGIMVLGAAAGAGSGAAKVGGAIIAGGQITGIRTLLSYTRVQENSADQAGLFYLDATQESARGLHEFLSVLVRQELLVTARQDPYLRTHPLTRDRLDFIAEHMRGSPWTDVAESARRTRQHARMRAKLFGFLERPGRVLREYPVTDKSVPARYARAVAYMRDSQLDAALAEIDSLIGESPDDPFFNELKGQILFESGKVRAATPYYQAAVRLKPDDPLLLTGWAQTLVETGDPDLGRAAIRPLERSVQLDPANAMAWRLLSVAHGREGNIGRSSLAAGEQALLGGRLEDALLHADRAEHAFPHGSPGWLRAQDIRDLANQQMKKHKRS